MLYNITELMKNATIIKDNPLNYTLSPYTNLFEKIFGSGEVFYFIPILGLSLALWYKTDEPVVVSIFLIIAGSILGFYNISHGFTTLDIICTIIVAIGITILIVSFILHRRE